VDPPRAEILSLKGRGNKAKIVVEVDGSQHKERDTEQKDVQRDIYLKNEGLYILRFNNLQVLQELGSVMEVIEQAVKERM
jgi:very-short-patch-repair endonuclease